MKNFFLSFLGKKSLVLPMLMIFLAAFILRISLINTNLFFGPEQGIDFAAVKNIVLNHDLTLIGAKTDIQGIYHGPIYYYVLSIPFLVSDGNPLFASTFLILLNSTTVLFLYLLGKNLKNVRTGVLSALIFAFSFNAIVYSRWLSTHPLAIPIATLAFLFFVYFVKGNNRSLLWFSLFLGLLMQTEFLNIIFFSFAVLLLIFIFFKRFKKQNILYLISNLLIVIGVAVGPFLLFDLRHSFLITNNVLLLLKGEKGYYISFLDSLFNNFSVFFTAFSSTITPFQIFFGTLVLLVSIIFLIKQIRKGERLYLIILVWIFSPLLILLLTRHSGMEQFFVALIPAFVLITALFLDKLFSLSKKLGATLVIVLIILNTVAWIKNIPINNVFFQSTQPDLHYSDQLATIDSAYQYANGKTFGIQTYTIPYWSQQGWEYLFWSYGYKKYKQMPTNDDPQLLFVIVQDDPSNRMFQNNWLEKTVKTWGKEMHTINSGILTTKVIFLHE